MLINHRYKLQSQLGKGGMGTVYLGLDTHTNNLVAIKETLILPSTDAQKKFKRLQREFHFSQQITHPNIVKGLDFFEFQNTHYIILEYIDGRSLEQILQDKSQRIEIGLRLQIAIQICDAIAYLNEQGIIHRDIKPANIILSKNNQPKILDLGIAKDIKKESTMLTQQGNVVGTFPYMSPEQFSTGVSKKTDTFALGAMFYQLFLWLPQSPYDANTPIQTMDKITNTILPPLVNVVETAHPFHNSISPILQQALHIKAEKRITTRELTQLLQQVAKYKTKRVLAKRKNTTRVYRKKSQNRKKQKYLAVAMFIILSTFFGFFLVSPQSNTAEKIEKKADTLYAQKQYTAAMKIYDSLLRRDNKNIDLYKKQANICIATKKQQRALQYLNKALSFTSEDSDLFYLRGKLFLSTSKTKQAISDFKKAIDLNPENARLYTFLGQTYYRENQYNDAIHSFKTALDLEKNIPEAVMGLGASRFYIDGYHNSIWLLNRSIELSPENAIFYHTRGKIHQKSLLYKKAINDFNLAIKYDSNNEEYYNDRGVCYNEMKKRKNAIKDFSKAIELNAKYSKAYYNRGLAYYSRGNTSLAIKDLQKAIELQPSLKPSLNSIIQNLSRKK